MRNWGQFLEVQHGQPKHGLQSPLFFLLFLYFFLISFFPISFPLYLLLFWLMYLSSHPVLQVFAVLINGQEQKAH
ncbi:hypothetical protein F4703DRAFT_1866490 [Phycomyces blakesleeanus]